MLELMRKHARNWLMKVLLGIIIIVFVFYFGSTGGRDKTDAIAMIDGKPVSHVDFQKEYQNLADFYRQRYGGALTDDMIKGLNLKQQAFDNLINQGIILRRVADLHLEVSDEEVRDSILSNSAFQRGGVFDEKIYQQILRYHKMTPADFEAVQKNGIMIARMEDFLRDGVKVSDKEVFDLYRAQSEKLNINFLTFSAKDFVKRIKPDRKDLESYLREHENDFRVPEKIQVKYISFAAQDFAASVKVSDAEVDDYYNRNKDQFKTKGGKPVPLSEARGKIVADLKHVQGMFAAAEKAKKSHDVIYQKENFDDYARQNGLKISVTDFFIVRDVPQEFGQIRDFAKKVMELQPDNVSSVLSDNQRHYIFKLVAKKPSHVPALKDIEGEVEKQYLAGESLRLCKKEAESILDRVKKGETLDKVSSEKGLKISETGLFQPGGAVPKIGSSRELNETLLLISEKNPYPDQPFLIQGSYVIVKFKEREALDNRSFETQKTSLKNLLLSTKRGECLRSWLENQKASMTKEGTLKLLKEVKDM
jgi:peptidyl-prolyl cis-trans isomerase D